MSKRALILMKNSIIRVAQMKNSHKNLNPKLTDASDISKPWDKDNQAWWDWYVSLADNDVKKDEIINADPLPDIAIPSDDEVISELAKPYKFCLLYTSPSPRDRG